jgi:hypothetical protein
MQISAVLVLCSIISVSSNVTCHAADLAWWVTWSIRPTGADVEGVPVRALNRNWRRASLVRSSDLPAASRQAGESPEEHGAVFSVDIDLDGDSHDERAVVGVYETERGEIGRFLLILGRPNTGRPWTKRALFSVKDSSPFSAIEVRQGRLHWVGCFECDDDWTVVRSGSGFRLSC